MQAYLRDGTLGTLCEDEGFSLVELMVVMIIIGILLVVATANYVFTETRSKETACKSNLRAIETALHKYLAEEGAYPATLDDLYPAYIHGQRPFLCPLSGNSYMYTTNTNRSSYTLTCPNCGD